MNLPTMNSNNSSTEATPASVSKDKAAVDIATLLDEPARVAWYRRPSFWVGLVVLVMLITGVRYWQAKRAENALPSYTTQEVTRGNLTLTVTANGTIQPTRSINIGSERWFRILDDFIITAYAILNRFDVGVAV